MKYAPVNQGGINYDQKEHHSEKKTPELFGDEPILKIANPCQEQKMLARVEP